jgi:RNA methyltransferase, TrmH family
MSTFSSSSPRTAPASRLPFGEARSRLDRLQPVSATHPAPRRYSRARRNLLGRQEPVTVVHGTWSHEAVLRAAPDVETVLWCPGEGWDRADDLFACAASCVQVARTAYRISERTLARIHPGLSAPTLLSVVRLPTWRPSAVLSAGARLLLVADGIEYAGNLGTLVRTADACGADGLVLTSVDARLRHPKVFVASRGTVLTLPVLEYDSVDEARSDLSAAGFTPYVADPAATTSYRDPGLFAGRSAVVVGSEGNGVCAKWRTPDLHRISIPMLGHADSLNVASSAAILLFEARSRLDPVLP